MRTWQLHASATVTGLDGDGQHIAVAEQLEFDGDAGLASGPNLAIKVGKATNLTAVNGGNHVAGLDAGAFRRTVPSDRSNQNTAEGLHTVNTEPRTRRRRPFALGYQVVDDHFQQLDRDKHVAGRR